MLVALAATEVIAGIDVVPRLSKPQVLDCKTVPLIPMLVPVIGWVENATVPAVVPAEIPVTFSLKYLYGTGPDHIPTVVELFAPLAVDVDVIGNKNTLTHTRLSLEPWNVTVELVPWDVI